MAIGDVVMHAVDRSNGSIDWTGALAGTITDEKGVPVVGARVRVGLYHRSVVSTDSRGRYTLTGLAKGARLSLDVSLPDHGVYSDKYVYANGQDGDVQVLLHDRELLGRKAPPLSAWVWLTGEPVALNQLQGRVALLVVGCLGQLHDQFDLLRSISKKYAQRGLEVIVVLRHPDSGRDGVPTFLREDLLPEQMASIVAGLDSANRTWTAYRINVAPMVYLIDKQGYIRTSTPIKKLRSEWIEALLTE